MSLDDDYRALGERLSRHLGDPWVAGIYLPAAADDETFRDEFGFVFLADGSVGPFYVSLGDLLQRLWRAHPEPGRLHRRAGDLLAGWTGDDLVGRALAVGTYNALSAALYRRAGFEPPDRTRGAQPGVGPVGMVGYFCPLVDKLTEQGREVLVLEQAPQRVTPRDGVRCTTAAIDLRGCKEVLCTASTLVNGSLEALLADLGTDPRIELIGPSGSGLPDPLFARGIAAVGGIAFADRDRLLAHLGAAQPWGSAGRKYQLGPADYPGAEALFACAAG